MPYFKPPKARAEIGQQGFRSIERLIRRHYGGQGATCFRAAPSIVCRSELELLGVAAPRFAHRTTIQSSTRRGFLNCRRLRVLGRQLENVIPTRWDVQHQRLEQLDTGDFAKAVQQLRARIEASSPVAESVLPPPDSCSEYHIIARDYSQLFGESDPIYGTPFLNAIELGGGVCAHGVCFMASLLRIDDAIFVHGPSEITAILQDSLAAGSLRIRGFQFGEFVKFFRDPRVGLNSYLEVGTVSPGGAENIDINPERENPELQLISAIRSYLRSDIPLIVLLDTRAYCQIVLANNRIKVKLPDSGFHCILLVGTRRESGSLELLAHDPVVSAPWLRLSISELIECRINRGDGRESYAITMYPVLPSGVKTHLLNVLRESTVSLSRVAHLVQWNRQTARAYLRDFDETLPAFQGYDRLAEFHLTDLRAVRAGRCDPRAVEFCGQDAGFLRTIANELPLIRWVWLQRGRHYGTSFSHSLWVWNAERRILNGDSLAQHLALVAVDTRRGGDSGWEAIWPRQRVRDGKADAVTEGDPGGAPPPQVAGCDLAGLKVSLISSFLPRRASKIKPVWPHLEGGLPVACEFYGFMLPDHKPLLARLKMNPETRDDVRQMSLHELLDWIGQNPAHIGTVADYINESFPLKTAPVVGLASYIPEISHPPKSHAAQTAVGSLRCLCHLALELRSRHQHPVSTIELVGGSRVVGLDWKQLLQDMQNHPRPDLSIITESAATTLKWLEQAIRLSVKGMEDLLREEGISLVVELEPGGLYVLNDLDVVERWLAATNLDFLRLNMDIGHFLMARHLHADQDKWDAELERMKPWLHHCHISRHSLAGHFGDNPFPNERAITPEMRALLQVYVDAFRQRASRGDPYVSVELEAAADVNLVQRSVQLLAEVIKCK